MHYNGSHDITVSDRCYLNTLKTKTVFPNAICQIYSIATAMQIHPCNKDFQSQYLIGWQHNPYPIKEHVRKLLLANTYFIMDLNMDLLSIPRPRTTVLLLCSFTSWPNSSIDNKYLLATIW